MKLNNNQKISLIEHIIENHIGQVIDVNVQDNLSLTISVDTRRLKNLIKEKIQTFHDSNVSVTLKRENVSAVVLISINQ